MRITLTILALLAAGCFDPTFDEPTCDPGGPCPDGLTCVDGVCRMPVIDPDAAPDDCYREADEVSNDTTAEATGITIGAGPSRVCGDFADRGPSGGIIDVDRYQIDGGGQALVARIVSAGARDYDSVLLGLGMNVIVVDGDPDQVSTPGPVGSIELAVQASHSSALGRAVGYELVIEPVEDPGLCVSGGAADHVEALDSATNGHLGNDVVEGLLGGTLMLTPDGTDQPEVVTATLDVSRQITIEGLVANTATQGDMYKDRDTFQVTTGPETTQVTLSLTWPEDSTTTTDDVDVDFYFLTIDPLTRIAQGVQIGFGTYEYAVIPVMPSTSYYVVVASWMDAQADKAYQLVLCTNDP